MGLIGNGSHLSDRGGKPPTNLWTMVTEESSGRLLLEALKQSTTLEARIRRARLLFC